MRSSGKGFSLVELMITVAILAILVTLAAPSFTDFFDKARVRAAADDLVSLIAGARTSAVKRGRNVTVSFAGTWCAGANEAATPAVAAAVVTSTACDCNAAPAGCVVDGRTLLISSAGYRGVTTTGLPAAFTVDGKLGNLQPLATHTVTLVSPASRYRLRVDVSPLGQATVCVPSGQPPISGYPSC